MSGAERKVLPIRVLIFVTSAHGSAPAPQSTNPRSAPLHPLIIWNPSVLTVRLLPSKMLSKCLVSLVQFVSLHLRVIQYWHLYNLYNTPNSFVFVAKYQTF